MSITERPAGSRTVHGVCHHDCPDTCGWVVETDDKGVAVRMRGDEDHPFSAGELCPKVNRFLDRVYHPDRVLTPLRRVGAKGSGEFEPVTWEVALRDVGERLTDLVNTHGGECVLPFSDAGNQSVLSLQGISSRFFNHIGASRLLRNICGPTVGAGLSMTNGNGKSLDPMEIEHSRLIVLWGTNTRLTNRHLWPTIEKARAAGARLVVIDPVKTITADAVDGDDDYFLQPLPGTDIALMLAVMHIIIRDNLVDDEWVSKYTLGFDELSTHVATRTPEWAAAITGLSVADIERFAHDYATIGPAVIRTLVGAEHHENGGMFFRTVACLPALIGAWKHRGGGIARSVGMWHGSVINEAALTRPDLLAGRSPRTLNMSRLGEILTDTDPPVRAIIMWNVNPLVSVPNAELIKRGMVRNDLLTIVHEQFMTDTAKYADYVFPATTQIESADITPSWGHLYLGWNEPAIDPLGESVSNPEFFRRLSAAMGLTEASLFDDDLTMLRDTLVNVDLDELRAQHRVRVPYPEDGRPFGADGFATRSGRVEFVSEQLEAMGQPRLPDFVAPQEGPGGPLHDRFPLQLMTSKRHLRFLNSGYSHMDTHGGAEEGPFIEIDEHDAVARSLSEGDRVRVFNDRGSLELPVRISSRVRPGVVVVPWGWWEQHHRDGSVANSLTSDTLTDWGGGVAFYDTLVEVSRL
ncbi:MAG: molybdopterin-dependent oxidoreductase [Actinomycetota bacterium]|nr:molybdopterin-dependent oxidoreductase [Actinomycetota bacterium]